MRELLLDAWMEQINVDSVWNCGYNKLYSNAGGIIIGNISKL